MCRLGFMMGVLLAALAFALPGIAAAASALPPAQAAAGPLAQQAIQQVELSDPGAATGDAFGWAVALEGDTALVGAPFTSVNGQSDAGVVYVYTRSGSSWTKQAALRASDETSGDEIGLSVALSADGDTALVGAPEMTVGGQTLAGVVYVFTRSGSSWTERAELSDPDPFFTPGFGDSLALDGDTALIGLRGRYVGTKQAYSYYAGAAYVYSGSGASWSEQTELPGVEAISNNGGSQSYVALSGDTALVSVPGVQVDGVVREGAAYVYSRSGTSWSGPAELSDPGEAGDDWFGWAVALEGDTALIGGPGEPINGMGAAGAVFVYDGAGTSWSQQAELKDPDPAISDAFGYTVALDGDTALVGAPDKTVNGVIGAVYVYARSGSSWSQQAELSPPDGSGAGIGDAVALSGKTTLISARLESFGGQSEAGAAYIDVLSSSDDTLKGLTVSAGTLSPSFAPATLSYADSVANAVKSITVTPQTTDSSATYALRVAGKPVSNPIALDAGDNVIDVVVTAADGTTSQTYVVTVTRAKSSDDALKELTVSAGTLSPGFSPDTLAYSDEVANDVTTITLVPTTNDTDASYLFRVAGQPVPGLYPQFPLSEGENVIDLVVTAPDGTTSRTYSVTVTRLSSDDTLKSLVVSDGELSPGFSPENLQYSDAVARKLTDITVTATPNDADATCALEVGGQRDTNPIALAYEGATVIDVVVTAADGTTSQTYSVTVGRLANDDALKELTVSAGELSPSFAPDTLAYGDDVPNRVTSVTVAATPRDEGATCALQAGGEAIVNPYFLVVGDNVIDVVVTAADGTSQSYSVTVTRAPLVPKLTLKLSGLVRGALTHGKRLTAKGTVTPASLAGGKVTLTVQRKQGGMWRKVKSLACPIGARGAFGATYRPAKAGTYRVGATITETATHEAAQTRWLKFKVK